MTGHELQAHSSIAFPAEYFDFSNLIKAVRDAARLVRSRWVRAASGEMLNKKSGEYVAGLGKDSLEFDFEGDPLAAAVTNLAEHAAAIEEGYGPYNLASAIDWSLARRQSETGAPIVDVPFRWGSPTAKTVKPNLPRPIYSVAKRLEKGERFTRQLGGRHLMSGVRRDPGKRATVRAFVGQTASGRVVLSPATKKGQQTALEHGSLFEGLFRGRQGHYTTIRAITPDSSWIIPGRAPAHIAQRVEAALLDTIRRNLQAALAEDVEKALSEDFVVMLNPDGMHHAMAQGSAIESKKRAERNKRRRETRARKKEIAARLAARPPAKRRLSVGPGGTVGVSPAETSPLYGSTPASEGP